jgi:dTDP-4-dehydrorhamnose 3,5-epimerase
VTKIMPTSIADVKMLYLEPKHDSRGWFEDIVDVSQAGMDPISKVARAYNEHIPTLRGLHYQLSPLQEQKVVRVVQGCIFDVVVDLRRGSQTFGQYVSNVMDGDRHQALFVPKGCAHGYLTMEPDTFVEYIISGQYDQSLQRGVLWSDPALDIIWPMKPEIISDRDRGFPLLKDTELP